MTTGEPYCAWCNQIGHAATTECQRAHNANQERQEFTARMMSNLDGEKDAQIERLTTNLAANSARVESLEALAKPIIERAWQCSEFSIYRHIKALSAALQQSPPQGETK